MFKSYIINAKEPNKGAINFSELLDAPAGKHGFLGTTEDGHLAFEDGKRFRIIGTSMVKSGCLPEHDVAECVAERLSSNGINMVRMHYADGICDVGNYDGNELLLIDYSKGNSRELNEVALEHLDYFIYQLKQRGIYVQLDTFVGRNWQPEGDGLDYPDTFPENWAPKNSNIFNRRMIELQKEFDVKFLTHFNPYTGLRYVDDPAIAVVQVMNENSMLWDFGANFNLDTLGPNYKRELQKKWTAWLKKKYGTNEALKEAWTDMFGVCALEVVENVDFSVQLPAQIWQTNKVVGSEHDAAQYQSDSQTRMSDFVEFLIETENAFTKEMYDHLRSIGVKCGINTTNLIRGAANVYTSTRNCTVQEHDAYYNHPYCGFSPPAKVSRIPMVEIDPRANVTGSSPSSRRATSPMRTAPAVCELEGPTIIGPIRSKISISASVGVIWILYPTCAAFSTLHLPKHLTAQTVDYLLFKPADVALRDAHHVGHLLLRVLAGAGQPKAHEDYRFFALVQAVDGRHKHLPVGVIFQRARHFVLVCAENVREQQLVAVPVGLQRLVQADLGALRAYLAQIHQDLILDAARGVGRKLYLLAGIEGVHGLDKPDGADGYQILDVDACVLKALRNIHYKAQIVLDKLAPRGVIAAFQTGDALVLLGLFQWWRQCVAAADVKNRGRLQTEYGQNSLAEKEDLRFT